MGQPITITVIADSAQASANVKAFGASASAAFNAAAASAQKATVTSEKFTAIQAITAGSLKTTSRALGGVATNLAYTASFFVGPQAQQVIYGATLMSKEIKGISAAMKLAGVTAPIAIGGIVALTGVVAIGATGWAAYKAHLQEVKSELAALAKQADLTKTILKQLSGNRERLAPGVADDLSERLRAAAPDLAIKLAKEELALLQSRREGFISNLDFQGLGDEERKKKVAEFDANFAPRIAALQTTAAKPPSGPVQREAVTQLLNTQTTAESIKNLQTIRELTAQTAAERLEGFTKERAEAQLTFDKEIANLEKLKLQNATPEEQAELERAADQLRAKRDEAMEASYRKEREAQQQLAEETRKFYKDKEAAADKFYAAEEQREAQRKLQNLDLSFQLQEVQLAPNAGPDARITLANEEFEARKKLYDDLVAKGVWTEDQLTQAMGQAEIKRTGIANTEAQNRAEQEKRLREKQYNAVHDMFGNMAAAAKMFGQKGFAVAKGFAIAQATMDTASAAIAAYKATAGIPYVGPVLAPIAAAAAVAAGAAQISSIAGQQPTGFRSGGYTGDGDPGDVAGVVHKKEFVIPERGVTPATRPMLEALATGQVTSFTRPAAVDPFTGAIAARTRTATPAPIFSGAVSPGGGAGGGQTIAQEIYFVASLDEALERSRDKINAMIVQEGRKHFVRSSRA